MSELVQGYACNLAQVLLYCTFVFCSTDKTSLLGGYIPCLPCLSVPMRRTDPTGLVPAERVSSRIHHAKLHVYLPLMACSHIYTLQRSGYPTIWCGSYGIGMHSLVITGLAFRDIRFSRIHGYQLPGVLISYSSLMKADQHVSVGTETLLAGNMRRDAPLRQRPCLMPVKREA